MTALDTLLTDEIQTQSYEKDHPWSIEIYKDKFQKRINIRQGGLGVRPVYLARVEPNNFIGTRFKEIADACSTLTKNPLGRLSLICLGRTTGTHTLTKEIERLPPGDKHEISNGKVRSSWSDCLDDSGVKNVSDAAEIFIETVKNTIGYDSTGWLPLTGGVDSRVIAAAIGKLPGLRTYTRGCSADDDCRYAELVAKKIGLSHKHYPFNAAYIEKHAEKIVKITAGMVSFDNGHAIYPLSKLTQTGNDIVIPGINGEYGRSFWSLTKCKKPLEKPDECAEHLFYMESLTRKYNLADCFTEKAVEIYESLKQDYINRYEKISRCARFDHPVAWNDEFYLRDRVRSFTSFGAVIWSKRFRLELPFLNKEYLKTVRMLPPQHRCDSEIHKQILKNAFPELYDLPLTSNGLPFEPSLINRSCRLIAKKSSRLMGKRPRKSPQQYAHWLRNESRYISSLIKEIPDSTCGLVKEDFPEKLWKEHLAGKDHHKMICRLLTLVLYDRVFKKKETPDES